MASAISFQQISDSRFKGNTKAKMLKNVKQIVKNLKALPGVTVKVGKPRKVVWGPPEPNIQWRVDFYVVKEGRATTWDDVYRAVNKVKAVPFKKESIRHRVTSRSIVTAIFA